MELLTFEQKSKEGVEGKIVTPSKLKRYARFLHFDPVLLTNQKVLNFGSGGSSIGKELERKQIQCDVTDVDLQVVGAGVFFARLKTVENILGLDDKSRFGNRLSSIHKKSSDNNRSNFVQADGRSLPFEDRQFDTILALFSTYQIPDKDKEQVFRELMRVGNTIHCGPITSKDFSVLNILAQERGFDIIVCRPFSERGFFTARNRKDYTFYEEKYSVQERVRSPKISSPKVLSVLDKPIGALISGNYIVMQRSSQ